jgi:hypothetical protein
MHNSALPHTCALAQRNIPSPTGERAQRNIPLPFKGRVREGMGYFDHSHMHATALGTIVPGEGFLEGLDPAFQTVLLISKGVDGESNSLST